MSIKGMTLYTRHIKSQQLYKFVQSWVYFQACTPNILTLVCTFRPGCFQGRASDNPNRFFLGLLSYSCRCRGSHRGKRSPSRESRSSRRHTKRCIFLENKQVMQHIKHESLVLSPQVALFTKCHAQAREIQIITEI